MTHLSWVALHGMARSFIELDKAVVHVINLVSFLWGRLGLPYMNLGDIQFDSYHPVRVGIFNIGEFCFFIQFYYILLLHLGI